LVPQKHVLQDQVAPAAKRRVDHSDQKEEQVEHARSMTDRGSRARDVLPSDSYRDDGVGEADP
jgi:hypothetical protein